MAELQNSTILGMTVIDVIISYLQARNLIKPGVAQEILDEVRKPVQQIQLDNIIQKPQKKVIVLPQMTPKKTLKQLKLPDNQRKKTVKLSKEQSDMLARITELYL